MVASISSVIHKTAGMTLGIWIELKIILTSTYLGKRFKNVKSTANIFNCYTSMCVEKKRQLINCQTFN